MFFSTEYQVDFTTDEPFRQILNDYPLVRKLTFAIDWRVLVHLIAVFEHVITALHIKMLVPNFALLLPWIAKLDSLHINNYSPKHYGNLPMKAGSTLGLHRCHCDAVLPAYFGASRSIELHHFSAIVSLELDVQLDMLLVNELPKLKEATVAASDVRFIRCTSLLDLTVNATVTSLSICDCYALQCLKCSGFEEGARVRIYPTERYIGLFFPLTVGICFKELHVPQYCWIPPVAVDPADVSIWAHVSGALNSSWRLRFGLSKYSNTRNNDDMVRLMQQRCERLFASRKILIAIVAARRRRKRHLPNELWEMIINEFIINK